MNQISYLNHLDCSFRGTKRSHNTCFFCQLWTVLLHNEGKCMKQLTKHLEKKKCQPFPSFLYSLNCILDCCPRLEQSFVDKKLGESIHHPRYYFLSLHLIFHTEFSGNNIVDWGEFWKDDGQMLWIFLTTLKFWKFGWHMQHDIYIKVILIFFPENKGLVECFI